MKKSILFKSLFAGTLALSTFSAHAGLFNLGRSFVRNAATSPLAQKVCKYPLRTATAVAANAAMIYTTNKARYDDLDSIAVAVAATGNCAIGLIAGGSSMLSPALDSAMTKAMAQEKKLDKITKKSRRIASRFSHKPEAAQRVRLIATAMRNQAMLRRIPSRIFSAVTIASAAIGTAACSFIPAKLSWHVATSRMDQARNLK